MSMKRSDSNTSPPSSLRPDGSRRLGPLSIYLGAFVFALARSIAVGRHHLEPSPDGTEYLAAARSLVAGKGYQLPLHIYHVCEPYLAIHSAWGFRLPVYPALLAAFSVLVGAPPDGSPASRLYALNILLVAVACAIATFVAYRLAESYGASPAAATLAAVLTAWSLANATPLLYCAINLYSEPVGMVLALTAAALTLASSSRRPMRWLAGGLAAGLAAQARGELIVLPVGLALTLVVRHLRPSDAHRGSGDHALWQPLTLLTLGAAVGFVPLKLLSAASPCGHESVYDYHFRVVSFKALLTEGPQPSAFDFLRTHVRLIASSILRNARANAEVVLTPTSFLLGPVIVLACLRTEMLPGLLLFGVTTTIWFARDPDRFTLIPIALCAPVCAASIAVMWERWRATIPPALGRATALLIVAALTIHFGLASRRLEETIGMSRPPLIWDGPDLPALATRLRDGLGVDEAFAAVAPWPLYLATGHPGVLIPIVEDRDVLRRFLQDHPDVRAIVLRPAAPYGQMSEDWPESWLPDARWERVGDDRIAWLPGSQP